MKNFIFNIQSKGGAGKSMLTYFQALKNQKNDKTLFVDLDSSSKTSTKQLAFLKADQRLVEIDLTDHLHKIERENLFNVIEEMNKLPFETIFLDFGAPESQQFPAILDFDFTVKEFKEFEKSLQATFVFNIVMSGGPAYLSCIEYAKDLTNLIKGLFDVYYYVNEYSFADQQSLLEEITEFAKSNDKYITGIKYFGNIAVERSSGRRIIEAVKDGKGLESYTNFVTRTIINREIAKV